MNKENDYLKYYIAGVLTFIGGVLFCIAINMNKIADYITNDGEVVQIECKNDGDCYASK